MLCGAPCEEVRDPSIMRRVEEGAPVSVNLADVLDSLYRYDDDAFVGNSIARENDPQGFEAAGNGRWRKRRGR